MLDGLISIADLSEEEVFRILDLAGRMKAGSDAAAGSAPPPLAGKTVGMLFEKPSMRTRISFEVGINQLGGRALILGSETGPLGGRESVADMARVMSRYLDGIVMRVNRHEDLLRFAQAASIPVINGLSDREHPCQALSDVFTIREKAGRFDGVRLAYVGDGNNVARSLAQAAARVGVSLAVASPPKYSLSEEFVRSVERMRPGALRICADPAEALAGADFVYTDVWTSMGQEDEGALRRKVFAPYQLNSKLLAKAGPDAMVMHCLPAHRGEEITDEVIDGPASIVYDQAENRLHVQKAIMRLVLGR